MEDIDKLIGQPTFTTANKVVIVALKTNCIAMEDDRSKLGKLHCIMDTAHLEAGNVTILASTDPCPLSFDGLITTTDRDTHLINYRAQRKHYGKQTKI
jgi:hypothetical protein